MSFLHLPALLSAEISGNNATIGYVISAVITVAALGWVVFIAVRRWLRSPKG
ncbi:hypothetical protein [Cryobacterium roopkundense]|uniref:Uncharacterized protein n=1 Tax=Cryobacterium roopkundense TaxID=1001240 RepID=A0A7W9E374_9MICO|nr:hypothetical protein [Cryobacterium roopkundense]MBB5639610.1 hypothetical protein [Cryobacterium roopkundense]